MSDNLSFDMTGVALEDALRVAMLHQKKAIGWVVQKKDGIDRLILFWADSDMCQRFPAPLDINGLIPIVRSWLDGVPYPPKSKWNCNHEKGCRVYNEAWGHIGGQWETFVAIEPAWLLYGK
jgi:hypothetical protein